MNSPLFRKLALATVGASLVVGSSLVSADTKLIGSGASFPFPIYSKWFKDFSQASDGTRIDYQAKGSGAGIQDLVNGTVDFAASDAAMNEEEMAQVEAGVVLLPLTAGEVVLAYNLDGVDELKLPRDVYPKIFTGQITQWNDDAIAAANPGVELPDEEITVVVRSDSSGTTYVFSGHLSEVSESFKSEIGQGKSPQWPQTQNFVKAPKNDGITATIKQTPGAIGYIEYGYAKLTGAKSAMLQNAAGNYVAAGAEAGAAALASAEFSDGTLPNSDVPDLISWIYDPAGDQAYPIASFTWLLAYKEQDDDKAAALRDFVEYAITEGQKSSDELGYIPLPENVIERVRSAAALIQ
ncbi:phosphate ABC transporter substrate-binding protein PstS [Granulosicoccus antarcticus]|uniref:Phosphate-binding protein PstS n=1 Tax=Granulosicoccus antarcticus IMCC3135 TaxID=1192854 RepID=A0A2Z2NLV9_9GAMM|nr:phosphate ABC transporter substrate-binding protein PstS [Granulosicoccus antarcticus]ASJ70961.1 Phosphate-binding protein PstS [Granulosicoccus antarcticus IMCC3135]